MKIAIFHNFMDNIGGAEKVSLILARELGADIYTTVADSSMIKKMGFSPNITQLGWVPINAPFRQQLSSLRFRLLDLDKKYDFFLIAGDWALAGAMHNRPNAWYCHSPTREIWDLHSYTRKQLVHPFKRPLFDVWVEYNRHCNKKYVRHVDTVIGSSRNAQQRLRKYLRRDSALIYPPIETKKFHYRPAENFWLSVNRLISHKRIHWQIEAFRRMPEQNLVIVGSYEKSRHFLEYARYITRIKPINVTLLHWIDEKKLVDLYSRCRGLLATAHDEDFGMTTLEAMAAGKPVIATDEGGYRETVIDGQTGRLIAATPEAIVEAVRELSPRVHTYQAACQQQAGAFDTAICLQKWREVIYE